MGRGCCGSLASPFCCRSLAAARRHRRRHRPVDRSWTRRRSALSRVRTMPGRERKKGGDRHSAGTARRSYRGPAARRLARIAPGARHGAGRRSMVGRAGQCAQPPFRIAGVALGQSARRLRVGAAVMRRWRRSGFRVVIAALTLLGSGCAEMTRPAPAPPPADLVAGAPDPARAAIAAAAAAFADRRRGAAEPAGRGGAGGGATRIRHRGLCDRSALVGHAGGHPPRDAAGAERAARRDRAGRGGPEPGRGRRPCSARRGRCARATAGAPPPPSARRCSARAERARSPAWPTLGRCRRWRTPPRWRRSRRRGSPPMRGGSAARRCANARRASAAFGLAREPAGY